MSTARTPTAHRGVTLLELLVVVAILTVVGMGTMRVLGQARLLRGRARARSAMVLFAQASLDRLRTQAATTAAATRIEMPTGVHGRTAHADITPRPDGFRDIVVVVEDANVEGARPVRLASILPGVRK